MADVSVLLIDDHRVVRSGLRMLLESAGGIVVLGEAGTLEEARSLVAGMCADVAVVDLQLGEDSGLKLIESIKAECPETRVVVLTMHENDEYLWEALRLGAAGYVLKRSADVDLVTAIHTVMDGGAYVDGTLASRLVEGPPGDREPEVEDSPSRAHEMLSERELQVAYRVALGHTNAEIGRELYLSVKTVETYRSRAMAKIGLTSRAELVRYAMAEGWFADAESADDKGPANGNQ